MLVGVFWPSLMAVEPMLLCQTLANLYVGLALHQCHLKKLIEVGL